MVKWVQAIYDGIRNWQPPKWIKNILSDLNEVMTVILKNASESYIKSLKEAIIAAAFDQNMNSKQKFDYVFKIAKSNAIAMAITIKDSEINALIEYFVNKYKQSGYIK